MRVSDPAADSGWNQPRSHGCDLCAGHPGAPEHQTIDYRCSCGRLLRHPQVKDPRPTTRIWYYSRALRRRVCTGWMSRQVAERTVKFYAAVMRHPRLEEIGDE